MPAIVLKFKNTIIVAFVEEISHKEIAWR